MRRVRRRRGKGRWSANIKNLNTTNTIPANTTQGDAIDLCENPAQTATTISQQYTVKNIELSVYIEAAVTPAVVEDIEHYIMYVPQGMQLTANYNLDHPEYIMAYYYQGNPTNDSTNLGYKLKLKSRLARRLQTGDKIIYFYKVKNEDTATEYQISVRGLVRWWTKAN